MKTIKFKYLYGLVSLFLVLFYACKDDLSSLDTNKLPNVIVDTVGNSKLTVFQFDKLTLDPKVNLETIKDRTFKYEWTINIEPSSTEYIVIGNQKKLDYQVSFVPTSIDRPHQLVLKITDEKSGLDYIQDWPLQIRNGIGEGIVVVETYDNTNTDISHIMSPLVTPDFNLEKIRYKIYSSVNGAPISGLVNSMVYTKLGANNVLLAGTNNNLLSIKTLDYSAGDQKEKLFYAPQSSYSTGFLGNVVQNDIYVSEGKIYSNWLQISKFGLPNANNYTIPNIIAINSRYDYPNIVLNFYSEDKGHFAYQPSFASYADRTMRPVPSSAGVFNPNQLPNKKNIAASVNNQGDFLHLLKDKTTNKYGLWILSAGGYDSENWVITPSNPKKYVDLSNAPEIDQATQFAFLDNQQTFFYATKTKIYAVIYAATNPSFGLRYTAAANEEITSLKMYYQADYPLVSRDFFSKNGKQLILGTYNGTEGKVHVLPIINEGVGTIDQTNIKTYTGFGKILFTTTQL